MGLMVSSLLWGNAGFMSSTVMTEFLDLESLRCRVGGGADDFGALPRSSKNRI